MQTGMMSHNGTDFSAPYNPFGGYKISGFRKTADKYGFRCLPRENGMFAQVTSSDRSPR